MSTPTSAEAAERPIVGFTVCDIESVLESRKQMEFGPFPSEEAALAFNRLALGGTGSISVLYDPQSLIDGAREDLSALDAVEKRDE